MAARIASPEGVIMAKRMRLMLLVVGLFIASIGTYKYLQIRAAMAGGGYQPAPETVTTIVAAEEDWPSTLSAIGSVSAVQGVVLSADLAGVVRSIHFDSGDRVAKGQVLLRLDTAQEQAQLSEANARAELAGLNLARAEKLVAQGVIAQSELDRMRAEAKASGATAQAIRATIARKTIRAPFSGVLGIRQVDLGQRLNEGDPIVPLQALNLVYVDFALPQGDVTNLHPGAEVLIAADSSIGMAIPGRISAVNSVVDAATRNVTVQASLRNPGERLRPGMYVDVRVDLGTATRAITLPASAINFAPYGNSVFVVEQITDPKTKKPYKGVNQRFVKLGRERGDQVAVVSGLRAGEEVVTSGAFKLRPGASVVVDNKLKPSNSAAPNPADS
jgi:membrane fusion protein (multidrug efflux system)